jgi:hypothetical protein
MLQYKQDLAGEAVVIKRHGRAGPSDASISDKMAILIPTRFRNGYNCSKLHGQVL